MNKSIVVLTLVSALLMHTTVNGATEVRITTK